MAEIPTQVVFGLAGLFGVLSIALIMSTLWGVMQRFSSQETHTSWPASVCQFINRVLTIILIGAVITTAVTGYRVAGQLFNLQLPAAEMAPLHPARALVFMYVGLAATVAAVLLKLLTTIVDRYVIPSARGARPASRAEAGKQTRVAGNSSPSEDSKDYLREFNKANLYISLFFSFLFVVAVASTAIMNAVSGSPLAIPAKFLIIVTQALGGAIVHFINLAWFGAAWFGIRRYKASEAWVAGLVGWALFTISGVILLTRSLGAIGIVIAGLKVLQSGYRSRGKTELQFLEEYVGDTGLEEFLD